MEYIVLEEEYLNIIGKQAPSNLNAMETNAIDLFKNEYTSFPHDVYSINNTFIRNIIKIAICFQIDYMIGNESMFNGTATQSYSIGKYSQSGKNVEELRQFEKISYYAYNHLSTLGFTSKVGYTYGVK